MENLLNYIFEPSTLISIITGLAAFFCSYKMLEAKVDKNTKDIEDFKQLDLKVKIAEIQKDIQYMREKFDEIISKR